MMNLKQNGKGFGIFFSVSQKFGEWAVDFKDASKEEGALIVKTHEIMKKYGVMDNPELLKDVFNSLSEGEKNTCVNGLEVITKYMKYHPHGVRE